MEKKECRKTAVVYGANGFIGRALVKELLAQAYFVFGVVRSLEGIKLEKQERLKIILEKEIDDYKKNFSEGNSLCFNLSWQGTAGAQRADYEVQLYNVQRHLALMEKMASFRVECVVGASSISETEAALYMGQDGISAGGRFIYSTAKLAMDYMSRVIAEKTGIRYVNAQIANVYGEGGSDQLILHNTIVKMLRQEETKFTNGRQWYDFLYIDDAAKALAAVGEKGRSNTSYYLGSGQPRPLKEYLEYAGRLIDGSAKMGFGKIVSEDEGLPKEVFSIEKLTKDTGFIPGWSYESAIRKVIAYYKEQDK